LRSVIGGDEKTDGRDSIGFFGYNKSQQMKRIEQISVEFLPAVGYLALPVLVGAALGRAC